MSGIANSFLFRVLRSLRLWHQGECRAAPLRPQALRHASPPLFRSGRLGGAAPWPVAPPRARTRRPPRDPVNALLGFCYGMLVTECIGAAESVGLVFQMGFLHRPRAGRPSLALDLAEEFRALTDRFVVSLFRRRQIGPGDFDNAPQGGVYLSNDGRTRLIEAWEAHKETEIRHQLLVGR